MNAPVWFLSIFIVIYHATTSADGDIHSMLRQLDMEENKPDITQSEKSKLEEFRTTLIKKEILRMLGLSSPPNISNMPQLSKKMAKNILHQTTHSGEEGTFNTETKEIIVVAEPDSSGDLKNSLRFTTDLQLASISSATLVLRRPNVLTTKMLRKHNLLTVRIIGLPHRLSHAVGQPKIIESSRNWLKLDVTSIVKSKGGEGRVRNISVEVICKDCGSTKAFLRSDKRRPFLIFDLKPVTQTRKRRTTTTCSGSCCLVRTQVKFSNYGYKFIYQPSSFYLNYCKGTCKSRPLQSFFFKRFVLFNPLGKSNPNDNCCVAKTMRPLSILYYNGINSEKRDVPNVIVTDCHCA